jgi:hypothetical protein
MRYIERGYQKPLEHPLILGACLHVEHPHLKSLTKKNKSERGRTGGDTKDLNAIKGATNFNKGDKPKR